jgi:hypothetical protein
MIFDLLVRLVAIGRGYVKASGFQKMAGMTNRGSEAAKRADDFFACVPRHRGDKQAIFA